MSKLRAGSLNFILPEYWCCQFRHEREIEKINIKVPLQFRWRRGTKDSRFYFLKTLYVLLPFFRFLLCLSWVYPFYLFRLNLPPCSYYLRFQFADRTKRQVTHSEVIQSCLSSIFSAIVEGIDTTDLLICEVRLYRSSLENLLLCCILLNKVHMTFARHSNLYNSSVFHLNPRPLVHSGTISAEFDTIHIFCFN